ncbi:MAG: hypothetical protein JJT94_10760 [Bernardetiaceae bacterium]|nr:hypothetical protein [Bernardetiaceae bacterium]
MIYKNTNLSRFKPIYKTLHTAGLLYSLLAFWALACTPENTENPTDIYSSWESMPDSMRLFFPSTPDSLTPESLFFVQKQEKTPLYAALHRLSQTDTATYLLGIKQQHNPQFLRIEYRVWRQSLNGWFDISKAAFPQRDSLIAFALQEYSLQLFAPEATPHAMTWHNNKLQVSATYSSFQHHKHHIVACFAWDSQRNQFITDTFFTNQKLDAPPYQDDISDVIETHFLLEKINDYDLDGDRQKDLILIYDRNQSNGAFDSIAILLSDGRQFHYTNAQEGWRNFSETLKFWGDESYAFAQVLEIEPQTIGIFLERAGSAGTDVIYISHKNVAKNHYPYYIEKITDKYNNGFLSW